MSRAPRVRRLPARLPHAPAHRDGSHSQAADTPPADSHTAHMRVATTLSPTAQSHLHQTMETPLLKPSKENYVAYLQACENDLLLLRQVDFREAEPKNL